MNREETFDKLFKKKGGIYNTPDPFFFSFFEFFDVHIDAMRKMYPKLPPIYCGLINSDFLNASAGKGDDCEYYIGFNTGLLKAVNDLFLKIAASKSRQEFDTKISLIREGDGVKYDDRSSISIFGINQEDHNIMVCHNTLINKFLLYHEVCHVLRGHIDFFKNNFNAIISEGDYEKDKSKVNIQQTLEMDADSFAVNCLIGQFREQTFSRKPYWTENCGDINSFMYHFGYSLNAFFKLFGYYESSSDIHHRLHHPIPSVRMSMILGNVSTIFEREKRPNAEVALNYLIQGGIKADEDLCEVSYMERTYKEFAELLSSTNNKAHVEGIMDNWKELRLKLLPYAYATLPLSE
ncbi:hypothetical protein [Chryseobacterium fistulae]|uniref:Uncharacterized protein n=1 Tax=Chryseobacterium fistulae TaxID=2675058 RepID=A0A6N4XWL3_9FLAO|nr:hypothetical protein [Chryseobacterium fistulae]CAA7388033.1 hypothetical protein CHRY9393_01879 [Chryseobacterium fistulae]